MSGIVLSAAVRSTCSASRIPLPARYYADSAVDRNKVNSALDNPTSYFTASSLNARASDLGNLLDSVSNAVQTIQAANDGITSITKLVESAQATANQAQQSSADRGQPRGCGSSPRDVTGQALPPPTLLQSSFTIKRHRDHHDRR